jgi:hypothetical protein
MNYCPECAVAVRGDQSRCPLCGAQLADQAPDLPSDVQPRPEAAYRGVADRVRQRPWIIGAVTLGVLSIPAAVSLIVDLLINRGLTWSLIVLGALGLLLLFISLPSLVFYVNAGPGSRARTRAGRIRRFWLLMLLNAGATWGYLLYLDRVDADGVLRWAPGFGSLVTVLTLATIMLFFYTLQPPGAVRRGPLLFVWLSGYLIGLDWLIGALLAGGAFGGWSLIVAGSLIPVGTVYWIIEYLVSHSDRARRRLHV